MLFVPDNLLSVLILLPFMGILFILKIDHKEYQNIRNCTLWIAIFCFLVTIFLFYSFDPCMNEYQFVEDIPWISSYNIHYHVGVDSTSLIFLLLLTFLMPITILLASEQEKEHFHSHMIFLLCLESFLIGSFCSLDIVLFYIFSEAAIFSFLFIANIWGMRTDKRKLRPFLITTAVSSILFLVIFLEFSYEAGSSTIQQFKYFIRSSSYNQGLRFGLVAALFLRNGLYPFFKWFQNAYQGLTQSSSFFFLTIMSLGGLNYIIRFLPLVLVEDSESLVQWIFIMILFVFCWAMIRSIYYGKQKNFSMIAPSVMQMNVCIILLGILAGNISSKQGVMIMLMNYSLVTAGIFLLAFFLENKGSLTIRGSEKRGVFFAISFLFFSYLGIPGSLGFWGNSLIFLGLLRLHSPIFAMTQLGLLLILMWFGVELYYNIFSPSLKREAFILNARTVLVSQKTNVPISVIIGLIFVFALLFFLTVNPQFILKKCFLLISR